MATKYRTPSFDKTPKPKRRLVGICRELPPEALGGGPVARFHKPRSPEVRRHARHAEALPRGGGVPWGLSLARGTDGPPVAAPNSPNHGMSEKRLGGGQEGWLEKCAGWGVKCWLDHPPQVQPAAGMDPTAFQQLAKSPNPAGLQFFSQKFE